MYATPLLIHLIVNMNYFVKGVCMLILVPSTISADKYLLRWWILWGVICVTITMTMYMCAFIYTLQYACQHYLSLYTPFLPHSTPPPLPHYSSLYTPFLPHSTPPFTPLSHYIHPFSLPPPLYPTISHYIHPFSLTLPLPPLSHYRSLYTPFLPPYWSCKLFLDKMYLNHAHIA